MAGNLNSEYPHTKYKVLNRIFPPGLIVILKEIQELKVNIYHVRPKIYQSLDRDITLDYL